MSVSMSIPKIVHQTWKTYNLPDVTIENIDKMKHENKEYKFLLYNDEDIDQFIRTNYSGEIYECFKMLDVGAAKADFWRYCILYKTGGIYLDIDSQIVGKIDEMIENEKEAIISREKNQCFFCQWMMVFPPNHVILKKTIELACLRIKNKACNNIVHVTGPGVYSDAINEIMNPILKDCKGNAWKMSDEDLNKLMKNETDTNIKTRFFSYDHGRFGKFKYSGFREIYNCEKKYGVKHWSDHTNLFKNDI